MSLDRYLETLLVDITAETVAISKLKYKFATTDQHFGSFEVKKFLNTANKSRIGPPLNIRANIRYYGALHLVSINSMHFRNLFRPKVKAILLRLRQFNLSR